jgi:hypothetical protein
MQPSFRKVRYEKHSVSKATEKERAKKLGEKGMFAREKEEVIQKAVA